MLDNIPYEIQTEIINKLPVQALIQFRTVSKTWKSFIDSSNFHVRFRVRPTQPCCFLIMYKQGFVESKFLCFQDDTRNLSPQHRLFPNIPQVLSNTNFGYLNLIPIGSSHGLICLSDSFKMAVLWNPSIRKSVAMLFPSLLGKYESHKVAVGFGVNPNTFDPTILRISYPVHGHGPWNVWVFTLNSQCWKNLENEHLPRQSIRLKRSSQGVIGSFIYWAASERIVGDAGISSQKHYMIVSFDLVNHRFSVIDIPGSLLSRLSVPFYVSKLRDSLVIFGNVIGDQWHSFYIWELKLNRYNKITSFKTLFNIFTPQLLKLLGFTNSGNPVFEVDKPYRMDHTLEAFQISSQEFINLHVEADAGSFFMCSLNDSLLLLTHPDCFVYQFATM